MKIELSSRKNGILVDTLASIGITGFFAVFFVVAFLGVILGSFLWPYTINTWLVYLEKAPVFLWWHGALLGLVAFLNPLIIVASIGTFIAMMFLT